jgi:hypothetical protein
MNKGADLLREYTNRKMRQALASKKQDLEVIKMRRTLFIKLIMDTNGQPLLEFISINNDPYELIPSKQIMDHIRKKTGLTFNRQQLSIIKSSLETLGAKFKKRSQRDYFTNIAIKEDE